MSRGRWVADLISIFRRCNLHLTISGDPPLLQKISSCSPLRKIMAAVNVLRGSYKLSPKEQGAVSMSVDLSPIKFPTHTWNCSHDNSFFVIFSISQVSYTKLFLLQFFFFFKLILLLLPFVDLYLLYVSTRAHFFP